MAYSVQQIKFEMLSYIKEFGGAAQQWHAGVAEDAAEEMFETLRVDPCTDIWLWKPAVTVEAANLVVRWIVERSMVSPVDSRRPGRCVFLFRRTS